MDALINGLLTHEKCDDENAFWDLFIQAIEEVGFYFGGSLEDYDEENESKKEDELVKQRDELMEVLRGIKEDLEDAFIPDWEPGNKMIMYQISKINRILNKYKEGS